MDSVNMREARRRFSDIVSAAEKGNSTIITKRGRQVARIEPIGPVEGRTLPDLTEFRSTIKVKGKSLSKAVSDARKEARY